MPRAACGPPAISRGKSSACSTCKTYWPEACASLGHQHRLLLQGHAKPQGNIVLDGLCQLHDIGGACAAVIYQHQRLAIVHAHWPHAPTLPTSLIDQPARCKLVLTAGQRVSHDLRMDLADGVEVRAIHHRILEETSCIA